MSTHATGFLRRPVLILSCFLPATAILVSLASSLVSTEKFGPDFLQFWTAATLLSSGQDPYDGASQARVQAGMGWDTAADGLGLYDFLPYYYPPWLGLACVPLLPLGYPLAKLTWIVLNCELLLIAGLVLRDTAKGVPGVVAPVVVIVFAHSCFATIMGQVSPLILVLIAASWKLLDGRRDVAAGCVLALATIKPQLTGILMLAILCWSARQRRWGVIRGFAATLALLCLSCTLVTPNWPIAMLRATRSTPLVTEFFPWAATTWLAALRTLGMRGWPLLVGYLLVALPLVVAVCRLAIERGRRLDELISVSLIAAFFISPYCRHYDLPVLLIPVLVLIGSRLGPWAGAAFLIALTLLPYAHYPLVFTQWANLGDTSHVFLETKCIWVPLLIMIAWCSSRHAAEAVKVGTEDLPPGGAALAQA